jgi:hypothetical protein
MKARVIDQSHEYFDTVFNVKYLSYDRLAGVDTIYGDIVAAGFDEVEFYYDAPWEEEIIKSREILNIKKPKKASYCMYYMIIKAIEEHIGENIRDITVVDTREADMNKVWIKNVYAAVNGYTILINIVGKNNCNCFDIKISNINMEEFINCCETEIIKLKIGLDTYTKRINGLQYTIQSLRENKLYTCTLELNTTGA